MKMLLVLLVTKTMEEALFVSLNQKIVTPITETMELALFVFLSKILAPQPTKTTEKESVSAKVTLVLLDTKTTVEVTFASRMMHLAILISKMMELESFV